MIRRPPRSPLARSSAASEVYKRQPWDGALKDITHFPRETPFMALQKYVEFWERDGMPMTRIGPVEAKRLVLQALTCNQGSNIRLPLDLIANRASFIHYVLSLIHISAPTRPY